MMQTGIKQKMGVVGGDEHHNNYLKDQACSYKVYDLWLG